MARCTACHGTIYHENDQGETLNTALSTSKSAVGDAVFGAIKSGKNAKKKIVNFGLRIFRKKAFVIMCQGLLLDAAISNASAPCSRQIVHAR